MSPSGIPQQAGSQPEGLPPPPPAPPEGPPPRVAACPPPHRLLHGSEGGVQQHQLPRVRHGAGQRQVHVVSGQGGQRRQQHPHGPHGRGASRRSSSVPQPRPRCLPPALAPRPRSRLRPARGPPAGGGRSERLQRPGAAPLEVLG